MRLIDADALDVEKIYCYYSDHCTSEDVKEWLDEAPTIEAEPVRHGYWKNRCVCSECGRAYGPKNVGQMPHYNYCPNCGAKMDAKEEKENAEDDVQRHF